MEQALKGLLTSGYWWMIAALLVVTLVFVESVVVDGDERNLVLNPSFEQGGKFPSGWERWAPPGTILIADASVSHTGVVAALIESDALGAREYPAFKYTVQNVKSGEEYFGRVWARTENMTDLGGYLVIEFYKGNKRLSFAQGEFTGSGNHDWKHLTVRGMVPEEADSIKLGLVAHGKGKVWFDDAELVRSLEAPPEFYGDRLHLRIRQDRLICSNFLGFGAQGDFFLTKACNVRKGVSEGDRDVVLTRVKEMRPHIIRTFFDYKWWEPKEGQQTPGSEEMLDYVYWVRFLQSIGASVMLTPWGDYFAYSNWMDPQGSKLPTLEKRESMVRSLVDLVEFLRRDLGLTNVSYLCLMNEPDNDPSRPVSVDEFVHLYHLLDEMLKERGLRDEVFLVGVDGSSWSESGPGEWFYEVVSRGAEYCDGAAAHTYGHKYIPWLVPWIHSRSELLKKQAMSYETPKPLMITEFNTYGDTWTNPENNTYEYGLFLADFAITALREGVASVLVWCLFDTYYDDIHRQKYGLWRYKDEMWAPRPGFFSWSLITRYTRPGSRIFVVETEPEAPSVRAVALVSPDEELTILIVNCYARPLKITLDTHFRREANLRLYMYTRENVPAPGGRMIDSSGTLRVLPDSNVELELPRESFLLLTEILE